MPSAREVAKRLPAGIASEFLMLLTAVEKADMLSAATVRRNTTAYVGNLAANVERTAEIDNQIEDTRAAAVGVTDAILELGLLASDERPEIQQAKTLFEISMVNLAERLLTSKPSQKAIILGYGW